MITVNIKTIWTYQNVFPASGFPVHFWWTLWKSKLCWTPAILHPKRPLGRSLFTAFGFVFFYLFKLNCKISPFNISCIIIFREMVPPPIIPKLSVIAQTESSLPPVPKRCSGPSSSPIR